MPQQRPSQIPHRHSPRQVRVAVDVTPMLPGGENGGAKIFVLELLRHLSELVEDWHFILLTSDVCHEELARLDRHNVERLCVIEHSPQTSSTRAQKLRGFARRMLSRTPANLASKMIDLYWTLARGKRAPGILNELDVQLLFCPFSAPLYHNGDVPTVCVIYDLQFLTYPQFFDPEERYGRAANFREACRVASSLACISDYVRDSVLQASALDPSRVLAIPIQLATRLRDARDTNVEDLVLREYRLERDRYLLYPANFWQHKNHRMLLTAFAQYVAANPESDLVLVCTGQPGEDKDSIVKEAGLMSLGERCRFPGFLPDIEFASLLDNCRGVIFPSLYEGFGMPVLEAMEHGKPVACSNRTSLPEVAGDAALLFDPRIPSDIRTAIERLDRDDDLRDRSIELALTRRREFASPRAMARSYLELFRRVLEHPGTAPL